MKPTKSLLPFLFIGLALAPSALLASPITSCQRQAESQTVQRARMEPSRIEMHHSNYVLPISYSSHPNQDQFKYIQKDSIIDPFESKYQLSFKINLTGSNERDANGLYIAYTQTSWWQTYNGGASRPFRETNYLPEFFWQFSGWDSELFGFSNRFNRLSLAHLSNGSTRPRSRTRNYLYLATTWEQGPWQLELMPRIKLPDIREGEANPDLEQYIGHLDAKLIYQARNQHLYSLAAKGNPLYGHFGVQLDWSFPLYQGIHGLVQFYGGYAESLIDYNHENYRLSLGFSFPP